ncbi:MAG: GWxTD domain-containing protein [Candidatus Aminicenantes bacterium]|nr:GWxTD domain-containing protein [Candidatus Aminicenantes bacterium]
MTKRQRPLLPLVVLSLALVLPPLAAAAPASGQKTPLPPRYKTWLDEEVVYIITNTERDVFLQLQSDRERDMFIEAFWKHRDPTPNSPDNEFKTEHYKRIAYANRYLGRDSPRPGWRTDRGHIHIILGEPNDIQRFESKPGVYDAEIWFYQGKSDLGLPAGFNVVFFRENGQGEYRLYSPTSHGPQALLQGLTVDPTDYEAAYQRLYEIDPTLANASISLIPGEEGGFIGRPSLSSDLLLQRVVASPQASVEERYARKFLEYKDRVEVEYTANYMDSDALFRVFREPQTGLNFVHYALEPKRLSVNEYDGKYYTTMQLNGSVTTPEGRVVYQFDKEVNLNLGADQMATANNQPFDIHDLFPLVPGDYKVSILLKNEVSKEFTTADATLRIPPAEGVLLAAPLLGYESEPAKPDGKMRAFTLGGVKVSCQPGRTFARRETLVVASQLLGLSDEQRQRGEVRFLVQREDGTVAREIVRRPAEYATLPDIVERIPLVELAPANYMLTTSFRMDGAEVVSAREEFAVSFAEALPRPWTYARVLVAPGDPLYLQTTGAQLFNLGRLSEARVYLERARERLPESEDAAFALGRLYMALGEKTLVPPLLEPFVARETPRYEVLVLAGAAYRDTGNPAKGVEVLDKAVSHYGVNAVLLNALGDCYAALGRTADALAVWEKSLELSPDQPELKKKVEEVKKKK